MRRQLRRQEWGNASLYAMLIVPFAMILSAATVDISRWNGVRSSLQLDADKLALIAASMLPARQGVESFLQSNLVSSIGEDRGAVSVSWPEADSSAVTVTVSAELTPGLAGTLFGKQRLSRSATAALVPIDYAIVVADGGSLRPRVMFNGATSTIHPPWGNADEWPRSGYFECVLPPNPSSASFSWSWWNSWSDTNFQRWLTQACFNPVWSLIKSAAIDIIDNAASDSRARISLYFTPGNNQYERYHRVRSLHGQQDDPNLYAGQRGGFLRDTQHTAQAEFSDYVELDQLSSDELCLLLADPVSALNHRYEIPENDLPNPGNHSCSANPFEPFCGNRHVPYGRVSDCYRSDQWTLREATYYRQARLQTPDFSATPDIEASIVAAFSELMDERSFSALSRARVFRNNLSAKVRRRIIVLTDYLPVSGAPAGGLRHRLEEMGNLGVEVQIVAVAHEYLTVGERDELIARAEQLSDLNQKNIDVTVISDLERLSAEIVPSILMKNRQVSLIS